jgi:hypothetical protein
MFALRQLSLVAVLFVGLSAEAKGKGKIIDFRTVPKTLQTVADALGKEKKDATKRAALALTLDDMLRAKAEVSDGKLYDELAGDLLNDVLDRMCEAGEVYSTERGPDSWHPRVDFFFKDSVKIYPGRVAKDFRRKYVKKALGKHIDSGYRNTPLTLEFSSAANEDEFQAWTDEKGWGVIIHEAHAEAGYARIGMSWVSPGTKEAPGSRVERPAWVAFYKQPKPGVGTYQLLAIESETAPDWRDQPLNLVPPKTEPNDLERKLRLNVRMEEVRALPARPAFKGDEEKIFDLDGDGADKLEAAQVSWLDPYRESPWPMVRAAAELKVVSLGGTAKADNLDAILRGVKHAVVKAKVEELKKGGAPAAAPAADAGP